MNGSTLRVFLRFLGVDRRCNVLEIVLFSFCEEWIRILFFWNGFFGLEFSMFFLRLRFVLRVFFCNIVWCRDLQGCRIECWGWNFSWDLFCGDDPFFLRVFISIWIEGYFAWLFECLETLYGDDVLSWIFYIFWSFLSRQFFWVGGLDHQKYR